MPRTSHPGHAHAPNGHLPRVERPSFHVWQPLEAESILWEGQVLIVGGTGDMPALLVITSERLALIANGQVMLDFPRTWLRPQPKLAAENGIRLHINPEGVSSEAHPVMLRARDGRGAAVEIIAILTGRPMPVPASSGGIQIPNWKETVGAARAVALPNLSGPEADTAPKRVKSFWPPQESDGIAAAPPRREQPQVKPSGENRPMQTLADRRRAIPEPAPVPTAVSRAARKQGTREDGVTIRDDGGWQDAHFKTPPTRRRGIGAWLMTAAIFVLLFGGIGYVLQDRFDITADDLRDRIPQNVRETLGFADDEEPGSDIAINAPETVDQQHSNGGSDGTGGSDTSAGKPESAVEPATEPTEEPTAETVIGTSDNQINNGLGGTTADLPETEPAQDPTAPIETIAATEPADEPAPEPTAEPTAEPTVEPTAEPTIEPTVEPTLEPTAEPTSEPTVEPTEEPTLEPTVEPTPEPTVEPTTDPTVKVTETPVETAEATEEATSEPIAPSQEPSVLPETTPEQAVVANGFRYTVEGASVGATIPELPQINSVEGYGQWVVLDVYGQNMSGDVQVFDMSTFVLIANGEEIPLDSGTAWVNGLVGNSPAYGPTDAIQWAPGESHSVTLTFLAPAGADTLVLRAGDQQIDLTPVLQDPAPLMSEGPRVESDLVQGTVVDVIDGETIVVEIDGVQQTVRYLGLDVPTGDACYASEAATANRSLVEGQTVTIERQSSDVDARGNWVRDVWVTDADGQPVLVSQQLIAQGAAEANISQPNTRFAGWLQQTQASAQANGDGIWGACGE